MTVDDPYDVLGLPRDATEADVGRAYRREVRRHHPDTAAGGGVDDGDGVDDERRRQLARVQTAYALLRDAVRRAEHDRHPRQEATDVLAPREPAVHVVPVRIVPGSAWVSVRDGTNGPDDPPLRVGPVRWER